MGRGCGRHPTAAHLRGQPATEPYDQDGDGVITVVDIQRGGVLGGVGPSRSNVAQWDDPAPETLIMATGYARC